MKVTVLGSGTSTGVPVPGCQCNVCKSDDSHNKRLRSSITVESHDKCILVDTTTDLRTQVLRSGINRIDQVFITHIHADHVNGLDDLRSFNYVMGTSIPIGADKSSLNEIQQRFHYAFFPDPTYQGGAPPKLLLIEVQPYKKLQIGAIEVTPFVAMHGKMEVLGYRFNNFAYLTDCNSIPDRTLEIIKGVDTIILDGLRIRPHPTHFTIAEAVEQLEKIKPKKAYLTHISHEVDHDEGNSLIAKLTDLDVQLAYDELVIDMPPNDLK